MVVSNTFPEITLVKVDSEAVDPTMEEHPALIILNNSLTFLNHK